MSLDQARLYLVAPARFGRFSLAALTADLAAAGVDIIQLREKELEAGDVIRLGEPIRDACALAGVPLVINDRPDVALALDADGVHVGRNDVPVDIARRILGDKIVGSSSHSSADVDALIKAGPPDYIAVGPVYETPTKPGRPAAGLGLLSYAAERCDFPWFAIGGIHESNLPEVMGAGAQRVVVVRAITEAVDPPAAAARLRTLLDQAASG